jgi:hypothetical protein
MAKVWAYPDDLAPILAGIAKQEAHQSARLVGDAAGCCRLGWLGACARQVAVVLPSGRKRGWTAVPFGTAD